tara:strand:- start:14 stop:319 length:306 start_codon:yes stop_codon:yes gene_type:complete
MTEELDLTLLLEQHKKEKWEWQQKESQWLNDKNILENDKKIIEKLSSHVKEAREINKLHQELNGKLQKRLAEVEEDNKSLSQQISDHIKKYENNIRRLGLQ